MTPALRARVLELGQAGQSCRAISTETGVPFGSVARALREAGISSPERAARTAAATQARVAAQAEHRAELAGAALDGAEVALDGVLGAASSRELRDAAIALEKVTAAHARLVEVDQRRGPTPDDGRSLVGRLLAPIQAAYAAERGPGDHYGEPEADR